MTVVGSGSLTVNAKYKTGIAVDDVMTFKSGLINVNVERPSTMDWEEKGFGIKITNGFVMDNGKLTITARDEIDGFESRALKVDGQDCLLTCELEDTCTGSEVCDSTTGSLYGAGKGYVTINGGEIRIYSTDDAIQAGNHVEIAGGKIIAYVSQNDAVDSNGTMLLKGGLLIAMGATAPEGGIDSDMNSNVTYEGGIMIGIGGSNNSPQTVSAGSFITTSLSGSSSQGGPGQGGPGQGGGMGGGNGSSYAGKTFALTATGSSDAIAAFKLPSDFAGGTSVIITAPSLVKGTAYQFNADTTLTVAEGSELYDDILLNTEGTISGGTATSVTAGQSSNQGGPGH